jgi:mRNA-degrading endonuclease RelE of RelBE toxin-antitoxin system
MNAIKWTPKAAKQLRKLDRQYQVQVRDAANSLEAMPNCQNVKALTSHAFGYRL